MSLCRRVADTICFGHSSRLSVLHVLLCGMIVFGLSTLCTVLALSLLFVAAPQGG
jgi:hypothetical protein